MSTLFHYLGLYALLLLFGFSRCRCFGIQVPLVLFRLIVSLPCLNGCETVIFDKSFKKGGKKSSQIQKSLKKFSCN